jgi:hypothetical protein
MNPFKKMSAMPKAKPEVDQDIADMAETTDTVPGDESSETSHIQDFFDGLDDDEKQQLVDIVVEWKDSQMTKPTEGEVDVSDMDSEDSESAAA